MRPSSSICRLCGAVLLANTGCSPHAGDGCVDSCGHVHGIALPGSSTGDCMCEVTFVFGSNARMMSELYSGTPQTGPFAFSVGLRLSVDRLSCTNQCASGAQSHWVTTIFLSLPCGRAGAGGSSPCATRSVQSANICSARFRPNLESVLLIFEPL